MIGSENTNGAKFLYCEEISGPEPIIRSYNAFFDGLTKLNIHGTCYIPESPMRDHFILDENSTGFIICISDRTDEKTVSFDEYAEKFENRTLIQDRDQYALLFPSLSYSAENRKGAIRFDF